MTGAALPRIQPRDYGRYLLVLIGLVLAVAALTSNERFLFDPHDKEWQHISAFQWWLLPHGIAGAVALILGPFQFSDRLRQARPALHRLMGRIYIGAIVVASILSIVITLKYEPKPFQFEIWAQGGGWLLCALLALTFAIKRNIPLHRQWVARSYGFTFIFICARAPDAFGAKWPDTVEFVNYLWMLVFLAQIVPDLILQSSALLKGRSKPARVVGATVAAAE